MKNMLLALVMLIGITASVSGHANQHRHAVGATPQSHGVGTFLPGYGYYSCPWGTYPRYFYGAGYHVTYGYDYRFYPPVMVQQYWWIPGPGVYCLP